MIIVIDTNVLISAFVFKGIAAKVFDYCNTKEKVVLSNFILSELEDKLVNKFNFAPEDATELIDLIKEGAEIVYPSNKLPDICRDPDDNNILQLSGFAEADYLITGDKDLLILEHFEGTIIIKPGDFYNLIE